MTLTITSLKIKCVAEGKKKTSRRFVIKGERKQIITRETMRVPPPGERVETPADANARWD